MDTQIYKNFLRTEFITDKDKKYPILSERDDIVVIVDEAHRIQYKDLAENMRTGLPNAQITKITDAAEKLRLIDIVDYMRKVEISVVISEDTDEEAKFTAEGLFIKPHSDRMNKVDENGFEIEDNFKDSNNPLQLVFVCAMWLTGFDVPSVSTLYLDKSMKGHTLMQTIARANRVYNGKECGLIIDYLDVFKYLKRALGDYASDDGALMPVKDVEKLLGQLHEAIDLTKAFCMSYDVDLSKVVEDEDTFKMGFEPAYKDAILYLKGIIDGKIHPENDGRASCRGRTQRVVCRWMTE